MSIKPFINFLLFLGVLVFILMQTQCGPSKLAQEYQIDTLYTNQSLPGKPLQLIFTKGKAHNHPLMALWTTDTNNNYIETLFLAESIAKGVFAHGDNSSGKWKPGSIRRPAALPVWSHKRGVREPDGLFVPTASTPIPDAVSGPTPQHNFVLETKVSASTPKVFLLYFEINQSWDWNEHWTNNKYPNDEQYKTSCQPALIYRAKIISTNNINDIDLELIGRSSHNGAVGNVYNDLETITTAKEIIGSVRAKY